MKNNVNTTTPLTAAVTTLGCKVNQYESASIISGLRQHGVETVPFNQKADIYIVNTCAVTNKAGAQSRQMIRRALRNNPEARIIVTGCYAQVASQDVLEMAEQPICIVGNENKHLLVDIALSNKMCDLELYMGDIGRKKEICHLPVQRFAGRTRAYLKVQDGCNNFCSYCIVPFARGRVRSLPVDKVTEQVGVFAREGYREVVLTGIHVGMYGQDFSPPVSLYELLKAILAQNHLIRYRISSLEPVEVSRELLELAVQTARIMPHFHLPLQSGDDRILKKMNRKYSAGQFADVVGMIHEILPNAAVGVDVMVGFPGEDEDAFAGTVALIEKLPISYLHVFPFSKRPGTAAEGMPHQVPAKIKEERAAILSELDHKKRTAFYSRQVGQVLHVLAEGNKNQFKLMKGFSENYVPVHFQAQPSVAHQIVQVHVDRVMDRNVFGTLVSDIDPVKNEFQGRLF